jgi:hypothetical protein
MPSDYDDDRLREGVFHIRAREFDLGPAPAYDPRFPSGWPAEIYEVLINGRSGSVRGGKPSRSLGKWVKDVFDEGGQAAGRA